MAAYPDIPKLRFPLEVRGGQFRAVEQDSDAEVFACVEVLVRTPVGWLTELPEYGSPDMIFTEGDLDVDALDDAIATWEPRAEVLLEEQPTLVDVLERRLTISATGDRNQ